MIFGSGEGGIFLNQIKPEKAADFEVLMQRVRDAMRNSAHQIRQQQEKTWSMYRAAEPFSGNTLFVFVMDPAVRGADYQFASILRDVMPEKDMVKLVKQISDCYAGPVGILSVTKYVGSNEAIQASMAETQAAKLFRSVSGAFEGFSFTAQSQVTERNNLRWKYEWRVVIRNTGSISRTIAATIEFRDADGFPIWSDHGEKVTVVPADEQVVTGAAMISASAARRVVVLDVRFAER